MARDEKQADKWRANKGEWSELYTAMRLIGDGKIALSYDTSTQATDVWMEVVGVIRKETKDRIVAYSMDENNTDVIIDVNGSPVAKVAASDFTVAADDLMDKIQHGKSTFTASEEAVTFLKLAEVLKLKAGSGDKNDIYLTTLDSRTGLKRDRIGFSIKSYFGNDPTLFNTASASGLIYQINGINDDDMNHINSLVDSKNHAAVQSRCDAIIETASSVVFKDYVIAKKAKVRAFRDNLELLNPLLPEAIEWILRDHFFHGNKDVNLPAAVNRLAQANPHQISRPHLKYQYMFKAFLYATYCRMTASTLWDGKGIVNGGYIDVSKTGKITCHYALESDEFKDYLYNLAYLDFPSTNPDHGDYGYVYKIDDDYFFNLNFQIRLRKI